MKTVEQIKQRIEDHLKSDYDRLMIGACNGVHPLMMFVIDYYKEEHKKDVVALTEANLRHEICEYLPFAFEKAKNQRGLSANRSIWKFQQWLWALDDYELLAFAQDEANYPDYGLPILRKISAKYADGSQNDEA